jgi:hypothetical protein
VVARFDLGGTLKRMTSIAAALALACTAVAMFAGSLIAQTGQQVYAACAPGKAEIRASALPGKVAPGRCPVEGRAFVDTAVSAVAPPPGTGIYAENLTTEGAQELLLFRAKDGTLTVEYAGDDVEGEQASAQDVSSASGREETVARASSGRSSGECADDAYEGWGWRVSHYMRWKFNARSTPSELARSGASKAIRRGGRNVYDTVNRCGMGDKVPSTLIFKGTTSRSVDISTGARCLSSDGESVVGFGTLPSGSLGMTCTSYVPQDGWDKPTASDIRVNKARYRWTTRPQARSCRGSYDLESTITHERGHTFGLGHVSETYHRNLTMSPDTNGPCQSSERTLGRGDVLGLWNKFR